MAGVLPEPVIATFDETSVAPSRWQFCPDDSGCLALVGSEELARELAFETAVVRLDPERWMDQLSAQPIDFLLVDTDIHGLQPEWSRRLHAADGQGMSALATHCREAGIRIVAWLRMTVDEYQQASALARHADLVYAIDDDVLAVARADLGADRVALLPPAVQPKLHNPSRTPAMSEIGAKLSDVVLVDALAGAVETSPALTSGFDSGTWLVESYWDVGVAKASALATKAKIVGVIDTFDKALLSRLVGGELFTVDARKPRWRIQLEMLRAAASGALVGVAERGVAWPAGIHLPVAGHTPAQLRRLLADPIAAAAWRQRAIRTVLEDHTLAIRLRRIRADLGLPLSSPAKVSCLLVSRRPERIEACIAMFMRQRYPARELIVVLHGEPGQATVLPQAGQLVHRIHVMHAASELGLGDCLNLAFAQARGEYWAKLDDDDHYGPDYLSDLMLMAAHVDCDIVAKPLVFTAFESDDSLYWDPGKQRFAHMLYPAGWPRGVVCGATLAGRRGVLESVPFPNRRRHGADSAFLDACGQRGMRLLASDGFGFACHRSAQASFHTWEGDEAEIRARGLRVGGRNVIATVVDA
ncbi:hypothetical protein ASD14_13965 [Lysobacter sp. Root494]|nr:hypothetical protein ASD14_13965 [Lysobacter sp. Root494]